jgi:hypothetical protein
VRTVSFNGDYMSLAEAVGETTHERGWVVGEDFDPYDEDEVEIMKLVWEREAADHESARNRALMAENARLRALLGEDVDDQ